MMTIAPPGPLTRAEYADLWGRMCKGKRVLPEQDAYAVARRMRCHGEPVAAYPCPMRQDHGEHVWHVGHTPAVERVRLLARYLRFGAEDG